jgi:hypothetical protein
MCSSDPLQLIIHFSVKPAQLVNHFLFGLPQAAASSLETPGEAVAAAAPAAAPAASTSSKHQQQDDQLQHLITFEKLHASKPHS